MLPTRLEQMVAAAAAANGRLEAFVGNRSCATTAGSPRDALGVFSCFPVPPSGASRKPTSNESLEDRLNSLLAKNRVWREAVAAPYCPPHDGKCCYAKGSRRFAQANAAALHGGYCLMPMPKSASRAGQSLTTLQIGRAGNLLAEGHVEADFGVCRVVGQLIPTDARVLDVGAGQGQYKAAMVNHTKWDAYDAALNIELYTRGYVGYLDVCDPFPEEWDYPRGWDWIVSIEMAEHIPGHCEENFLRLLKQANSGIVLSWSAKFIPDVHGNAKPFPKVVALVEKLGFRRNAEWQDRLRAAATRGFLKSGMTVFERVARSRPLGIGELTDRIGVPTGRTTSEEAKFKT